VKLSQYDIFRVLNFFIFSGRFFLNQVICWFGRLDGINYCLVHISDVNQNLKINMVVDIGRIYLLLLVFNQSVEKRADNLELKI
jgi:hypothetical protein